MDTIVEEIFSAKTLLLTIISYSVGMIPFGLILNHYTTRKSSLSKNDLPGKKILIPLTVVILDVVKGYITGSVAISLGSSLDVAALCGLMAVVGNCFPIWMRFSGGKGAATALGALLLISWPLAAYTLAGFAAGFFLLKQFLGGSLLGALTGAISGYYLLESSTTKIIVLLIFVVILARHEDNLWRIFSGRKR